MTLDDLNMTQLREMGYLLEEYVEREVRGTSIDGLRGEVSEALLELGGDEFDELLVKLEEMGLQFDGAAEEEVDGEAEENDSDVDDDEAGDQDDGETQGEPAEEEADEDDEEPLIIHVRCHPREGGLYNGDLICAPKQFIVDRYPHTKLTSTEARSLAARGYRWNTDPRYSESPNEHP